MKSRIKEQGSAAHIVVIVVLVLAVLGLLGFVFWQNFMNKTETATSTTETTTTTEPVESTEQKLTVSEWGIEGSYTSTKDLEYKIDTTNDISVLEFTSPAVAAIDGNCNEYTAGIVRYLGDEVTYIGAGSTGNPESTGKGIYESMDVPNASWEAKAHIGDYYYFMSRPQSACESDQADALIDVQAAALEFLLDAKLIN
ncbi:MAG: hypothetical protein WA030_04165 [Candidatus Microsaccharimonas sp.]